MNHVLLFVLLPIENVVKLFHLLFICYRLEETNYMNQCRNTFSTLNIILLFMYIKNIKLSEFSSNEFISDFFLQQY